MLHLLGFDHKRLTYRYAGRDFRLTDVGGHVIQELLG
jgi:ssRNA-specific RNase YbeY (16S rRNA maturation enzyme)